MEFYQNLYADESVRKRMKKIKEKLQRNQFMPFIHVITLPVTGDGMLEIYPAYILMQKEYKKIPLKVVGIASGREEAVLLVQEITENCLRDTGTADLKTYLEF